MPHTILLVEDSADDAAFVTRALRKTGIPNLLQVVEDGRKALDYLSGKKQFADRTIYPLPRLVLLDLKLPEVSGFDVLRWIRSRPELAGLIVVVLTSSDHPDDIRQAYALGANSFLSKPGNASDLGELIRGVADYWLRKNVANPISSDEEARRAKNLLSSS